MTDQNPNIDRIDLAAEEVGAEELGEVTSAGFTTANTAFTGGTASCPGSSASTASSFSSTGN
ncbi:thiocillin family RiPP [Planomonospora sp. ID67723]|uniref:thiocillin family RiPP n=1 Tax=Planomonospora sp. ID67723 TaxID=2738134 RepID=UPI0018C43855|nr:thiocillin family RiPP [Planomonospora sp. ID67723]MBG0827796.1 thiocillin family RiPP [Planomonospora sp. ID67723]